MKEIWKNIKNYENYEISNLGNVKNKKTKKILKTCLTNNGYLYVDLWKNNKRARKNIHRLIAETFIPNINNYSCINHIDGNKQNNKIENLEWCTYSHNIKEAYKLGLKKVVKPMLGKKDYLCPNSKKINQFDKEYNFIKQWGSTMQIERELGIRHTHISNCCLKKEHYKTSGGFIWEYAEVKTND